VLGTWLAIGIGAVCARLPLGLLLRAGDLLGRAAWHVGGRRRRITETNLSLCFPAPAHAADARERLARATFRHLGISVAETLVAWLHPRRPLDHLITFEGFDALRTAAGTGHGVLLIGAHFACMEFIGGPLGRAIDLDVVYRRNRNPAWQWLQRHGRGQHFRHLIERDDTRAIVRALRNGRVVWYAPDQDYGPRHAVFAPFFGVPAATLTATSRIAALTGAHVFFMSQHRDLTRRRWCVQVSPVTDYPTGNPDADARRLNAIIETAVRVDPAQYLWLHRRFKTRPTGADRLY
jgi:KDO2-lipid IV(A) lauroyltransferase